MSNLLAIQIDGTRQLARRQKTVAEVIQTGLVKWDVPANAFTIGDIGLVIS